jgi:hypothetical protein
MSSNVVFTRTVTPNSGYLGATLKFAQKRVAAIKKHCDVEVTIRSRVGGPAGQLILVSYHDDLQELEKVRRKVMKEVLNDKIPQPNPGMIASVEDAVWMNV